MDTDDLGTKCSRKHCQEVVVTEESFEYLSITAAYLSTVDLVKELEEYKCIVNIGQVSSLVLAQLIGCGLCLGRFTG